VELRQALVPLVLLVSTASKELAETVGLAGTLLLQALLIVHRVPPGISLPPTLPPIVLSVQQASVVAAEQPRAPLVLLADTLRRQDSTTAPRAHQEPPPEALLAKPPALLARPVPRLPLLAPPHAALVHRVLTLPRMDPLLVRLARLEATKIKQDRRRANSATIGSTRKFLVPLRVQAAIKVMLVNSNTDRRRA